MDRKGRCKSRVEKPDSFAKLSPYKQKRKKRNVSCLLQNSNAIVYLILTISHSLLTQNKFSKTLLTQNKLSKTADDHSVCDSPFALHLTGYKY